MQILGQRFCIVYPVVDPAAELLKPFLCIIDKPEDNPRPRFVTLATFLVVWLVSTVVINFMSPPKAGALIFGNLLIILAVNAVILIQNMEDAAIPYIRLVALWMVYHAAMFHGNPVVPTVFATAFVVLLDWFLGRRVLTINTKLTQEKDLLVKARDVVVSMLYDISSSEQGISSLDITLVRILEAITEALSVEGAAIYTREDFEDDKSALKFSQSS